MTPSTRAARALLFQKQCRQSAAPAHPSSLRQRRQQRTYIDSSSLNPENFGKKLSQPIPSQAPSTPNPQQSQAQAQGPSQSHQPTSTPTPTPTGAPYTFPRARDAPIPRYRHNPAVKPGLVSFLKYRILRLHEPPNPNSTLQPSFNVLTNPYRARKQWPPILSHLSDLQQFHYEKKFRRRLLTKTKNGRATWDNSMLLLRRVSIALVVVYFALIVEPGGEDERLPSDGLRYWIFGHLKTAGTSSAGAAVWPDSVSRWIDDKYAYYRRKHKRQWDPYNLEGWDVTRAVNTLPETAAADAVTLGEGSMRSARAR